MQNKKNLLYFKLSNLVLDLVIVQYQRERTIEAATPVVHRPGIHKEKLRKFKYLSTRKTRQN